MKPRRCRWFGHRYGLGEVRNHLDSVEGETGWRWEFTCRRCGAFQAIPVKEPMEHGSWHLMPLPDRAVP